MTDPIAVVGIDCRFPGAADKDAFWDLLIRSEHGISRVPSNRWDTDAFYAETPAPGRVNTPMGGFISDPDAFDHEFFGISPREAAAMDPQQRLVLHGAWRALEDACLDPARLGGSATGVYVGMMSSEWATLHLSDYQGLTAHRGSGNGYCMAANRVSYHLDLKGPSAAIDTACSSSLVAVHLAANALRTGDCDLAIVAGVNLLLTPALSIFYTQAGLSASDGRCKPFSANANGIGRGEGIGVVVLRRLSDAVTEDQPIYAVIDGSAVNQDGRSNGITAPNRWSQQQVVQAAYRRAGVDPGEIAFVEGHGTGTILGDLIEVRALGAVHCVERAAPCALGSVKGNIGHTEGAAGIAGFIKACLALDRRLLPPTLHSESENPELRLAEQGLRLADRPTRLGRQTVRAGVSSFGLGGTNAHVVLSTAPVVRRPAERGGLGVLTVSANTAEALYRNVAVLTESLDGQPPERLAQICHSTNRVKSSARHRIALPAMATKDLVPELRRLLRDASAGKPRGKRPRVAFLFTGQGAQYAGMTRPLYDAFPGYRERFDEADLALRPYLGHSIKSAIFSGTTPDGLRIDDTALTQPALFAVGYALAAALGDLGVHPDMVLGHSIGEYAAACVAGVLTLDEAARVVVGRGALMQRLPAGGAMVSVHASAEDVAPLIAAEPQVSIAAINGPEAVVISGDDEAVHRVTSDLRAKSLPVSHAFHSPLMRPMLEPFAEVVAGLQVRRPSVPFASTLYGRFVDELPPDYWGEQVCAPVLFEAAMRALAEREPTHLIEIGPRRVLTGLAGACKGAVRLVPVPGPKATGSEVARLVAALYQDGLSPRWEKLYTPGQRVPRRLPPYVFADTGRFWASAATVYEPLAPAGAVSKPPAPAGAVSTTVASTPPPRTGEEPAAAREDRVLRAIAEIGDYALADLRPEARLHEDLGYDSIMVMQLADRLTDLLGLDEPLPVAEFLPHVSTVGDLKAFMDREAAR